MTIRMAIGHPGRLFTVDLKLAQLKLWRNKMTTITERRAAKQIRNAAKNLNDHNVAGFPRLLQSLATLIEGGLPYAGQVIANFEQMTEELKRWQRWEQCEDMRKRVVSALHRTWSCIGPDVMMSLSDGTEQGVYSVELDGKEVQEHVTACGILGGYVDMHGGDPEAVKWFAELDSIEQDMLLEDAWHSDHTYCM
jgi:hypothetical protein